MVKYEDVLDELQLAPKKRGWRSFIWRHLPAVTTALLVALLMIAVLWPSVVITVPSGHVGVYWKRIGENPDAIREGVWVAVADVRKSSARRKKTSA